MKPPPGTVLCAFGDIENPGAKGFAFGEGVRRYEMFLVRRGGEVFAYENACPHLGAPLETLPDQFLTRDKALIVCSFHGAQFQIGDGLCIAGPCKGKRLAALAVTVKDGTIALA
jgi:nitrite reductase/ring-hydroxylating ferredoxin subunit